MYFNNIFVMKGQLLDPARFLHSSYTVKVSENSYTTVVSGGMSSKGRLSVAPTIITLTLADNGAVGNASERASGNPAHESDVPKRYGSASVSVCDDSGAAAAAFSFGGLAGGDALVAIINESSDLSARISSAVAANRSEREKQQRDLLGLPGDPDQGDERKDNRVQRKLSFPSGDSYFGEVDADSSAPNGHGVLSYSDGSRYEVRNLSKLSFD
jgi:hypothetical protein